MTLWLNFLLLSFSFPPQKPSSSEDGSLGSFSEKSSPQVQCGIEYQHWASGIVPDLETGAALQGSWEQLRLGAGLPEPSASRGVRHVL